LKVFLNHTFLPCKTTKLLLPVPPKKQAFGLVPIQKQITYPNPVQNKPPLVRGGIIPSSPPTSPKQNSFEEKKKKTLTPCPFFLKLHLQFVILSI